MKRVVVILLALLTVGCGLQFYQLPSEIPVLEPPPAPELHARYNKQAIRCTPLICFNHVMADCEPYGGMRNWAIVVEERPGTFYPEEIEVACVGQCRNGVEVSHDCKGDPPDWRVAESR